MPMPNMNIGSDLEEDMSLDDKNELKHIWKEQLDENTKKYSKVNEFMKQNKKKLHHSAIP